MRDAIAREGELRPDHRDLERRLAGVVAHQRVRQRERHRVHRSAGTQAHVLQAVAPVVLQRREQARAQNPQAHFCSAMNSSAVMARKRTRSPAEKRLGWLRPASNTLSGVRPMTLQPPEMA